MLLHISFIEYCTEKKDIVKSDEIIAVKLEILKKYKHKCEKLYKCFKTHIFYKLLRIL